jgi:hypothetical protein
MDGDGLRRDGRRLANGSNPEYGDLTGWGPKVHSTTTDVNGERAIDDVWYSDFLVPTGVVLGAGQSVTIAYTLTANVKTDDGFFKGIPAYWTIASGTSCTATGVEHSASSAGDDARGVIARFPRYPRVSARHAGLRFCADRMATSKGAQAPLCSWHVTASSDRRRNRRSVAVAERGLLREPPSRSRGDDECLRVRYDLAHLRALERNPLGNGRAYSLGHRSSRVLGIEHDHR